MVLHDSHAEVLALRALNRFLINEVIAVLQDRDGQHASPFVCLRDSISSPSPNVLCSHHPFELRRNISIWMFSTEAPCGDASMEVLMSGKEGDVEPWAKEGGVGKDGLEGRGYFSALGIVRRKPARRDAEATMSKSCTDKLTLKQVMSILCFPASLIIASTANTYLSGLIVPSTRYSEEGFVRAFGPNGRLSSLQTWQLPASTQYRPFQIFVLPSDFEQFPFSRTDTAQGSIKAGNVSAVFVRRTLGSSMDTNETILGGVKQGHRPFESDPKKPSVACRLKLWEAVRSIIDSLQEKESIPVEIKQELSRAGAATTYAQLKASDLHADRRAAKGIVTRSLGKWPKNSGDENWGLAACGS